MITRLWEKRSVRSGGAAILYVVTGGCGRGEQGLARRAEVPDSAGRVQSAPLAIPDTAKCARRNQIPLILERDGPGQYRVNQVSLNEAELKHWIDAEFRQRPIASRWLMIRDPSTFETQELSGILRQVIAAEGNAYQLDPRCVPEVPARSS